MSRRLKVIRRLNGTMADERWIERHLFRRLNVRGERQLLAERCRLSVAARKLRTPRETKSRQFYRTPPRSAATLGFSGDRPNVAAMPAPSADGAPYTLTGCLEEAVRVPRKTSGTAIALMTTTDSQMAPGHCFWTTK